MVVADREGEHFLTFLNFDALNIYVFVHKIVKWWRLPKAPKLTSLMFMFESTNVNGEFIDNTVTSIAITYEICIKCVDL